jgi:hypothetical protein
MVRKATAGLTYANVIATLALFLALGGGAYAAITIPNNSVGTKQIKRRAVTLSKISTSARTALRGLEGARGPKGDACLSTDPSCKGPKGDACLSSDPSCKGPKGDAGPGALSIPITHVDAATFTTLRTIHGINVGYSCSTSSEVTLKLTPAGAFTTVYVSGEKAENGALSALNTNGAIITASASSTANLDAIAMADGTWNRIDLGGFGGGGTTGCNIWGLMIPGT